MSTRCVFDDSPFPSHFRVPGVLKAKVDIHPTRNLSYDPDRLDPNQLPDLYYKVIRYQVLIINDTYY